jgi:hypothetical protein
MKRADLPPTVASVDREREVCLGRRLGACRHRRRSLARVVLREQSRTTSADSPATTNRRAKGSGRHRK